MLQFASNNLKADRAILMEAVRDIGSALRCASNEHKFQKSYVLQIETQ